MPPALSLVTRADLPAMADFPTPSLAQLWLWAGVPLMGFVALAIAAIAGIGTIRRSTGAPRARSAAGRAMALALGLPVFPLIPIACHEARVNLDDDLISVLAWLSVLFFAGGCVWLTRSGRSLPRPDGERASSLARLFWIVSWIDVLIGLPVVISLKIAQVPQYDLSDAVLLLLCIGLLGGAMKVVALTRNPVAFGIGLALAIALPLLYGNLYPLDRATPGAEALQAGHGYFRRAADRALADAIVVGDGPKAVSLVPAVNPNTVSWKDMTFMRLALERGHADVDPDVVAALLKAGADPDQDSHLLFHFMAAVDPDAGATITAKNQRLLTAVFDAGVDLNHVDQSGLPRFFHVLDWPAGLDQMLRHGANTEAEDTDGNTAIMSAVWNRHWLSIDVLLAHGARIDHVNRKGMSLRDMALVASKWDRDIAPQLAALTARFR